jgi:hypothetical protein
MGEEGRREGGGEGGWGGGEEVFESLYSAWCFSPVAALALCLFCQVCLFIHTQAFDQGETIAGGISRFLREFFSNTHTHTGI